MRPVFRMVLRCILYARRILHVKGGKVMGTSFTRNEKLSWSLAVLTAAMVLAALLLAFPQQAQAAAKTVYLPTKIVESYSHSSSSDRYVYKNTYNKYGLLKSAEQIFKGDDSSYKVVYTRNKKGFATGLKFYDNGTRTGYAKTTIKNGKVKKITEYRGNGKINYTTSFTYKNGKVSKSIRKGDYITETTTYYANGNRKKVDYKYEDDEGITATHKVFNNKGLATKYTYTYKSYEGPEWDKFARSYKYTYNNKGYPKKIIETVKSSYCDEDDDNEGEYIEGSYNDTLTITYRYIHDKNGNIAKRYETCRGKNTTGSNYETTVTYTYKKYKVPEKYWPLFKSFVPGGFNSKAELMWADDLT